MGASSSREGARSSTSISKSELETEASSSHSRNPHFTSDNEKQRVHGIVGVTAYDGEDESRSKDPSFYATLRTGELWDQRQTVPSSTSVTSPKRETLLTYAAQMTGWQSADGHGIPMYQPNNETMELSRIITQLAMANHQLASTHNATLARMETLYLELSKEREQRKQMSPMSDASETYNDVLQRRLRNTEEDVASEETRKLEQRVLRLESLLAANSTQYSKQKGPQEEEKSCNRIERSERQLRARDARSDDRSDPRFGESPETDGEVLEDLVEETDATTEATNVCECYNACFNNVEIDVSKTDKVDSDKTHKKCTGLSMNDKQDPTKGSTSEEVMRLLEEIERLKADRTECQSANERLLSSLADQKNLAEKVNEDYEELKTRHATAETDLHEYKWQHDELARHLDSARKEIERLLGEIDVYRSEKHTAEARTSTLEQDLQQSLLEKEHIMNTEKQKVTKLREQLTEEISDKEKQFRALQNALQEIQRLKETVKTESRDEADIVLQESNIDDINLIEAASESTDAQRADMEEFKKEIILKREARQRAIAAVSSEMEKLRRELDAEKEAHSKTLATLTLLRSAHGDSRDLELASDGIVKAVGESREQRETKYSNESEKASKRAEAQRLTNTLKVSDELRNDVRYQIEKVDDLRYHLETDPERHRHRIRCLTEVTNKTRESLKARERQTNELKDYLAQMLVRLGDRSFLEIKDEAGAECRRQLDNISVLKSLYNERLRVLTELRESAMKELVDVKQKLEYSLKKSENLEEELKKAEEKVDTQASEITNLESQLGLTKADCRDLQNQMSLINGLFTQMLLGASSADMDLDRLTQLLQENHDLISDIAREESTEAAALPKLLLDLVEQVEGGKTSQKHTDGDSNAEANGDVDRKEDDLQEENIAHNLPKVWRVLLELLSCHAVTSPSVSVASCSDQNSCYKSVDTPTGPTLVISVSKTYIRLKELILEKKHLEKEMNRMKQLNAHLESKLGEQEKRLSMVSDELTKTWNIVGRMQAQHQQLHTHEEILRYELQQKRKMLQELKQELEYCREKWESARQKNTNTELEWRNLRREFAARKALVAHDSFNSAESGFSDERGDDTDEEEEAIEGRIRHGPRRRTRKESPRAPTPDTESEQPTDTELSESKTGSSVTMEQRTPTPETEAELDEIEVADVDSELINAAEVEHVAENTQETLDPLDQALTNVIQNLIRIDEEKSSKSLSVLLDGATPLSDDLRPENSCGDDTENDLATTSKTETCEENPRSCTPIGSSRCSPTSKTLKRTTTSIDLPSAVEKDEPSSIAVKGSSKWRDEDDGEMTKSKITSPSSVSSHVPVAAVTIAPDTTPVFSIGPYPTPTVSSIKSVQFSNPLIVGPSNRIFAPVFGAAAAELDSSTDNSIDRSPVDQSSLISSSQGEESAESKDQRSFRPAENVTDSDSISVDSSSSLDTVREFPTADSSPSPKDDPQMTASSSQKSATVASPKSRTPEEVLAARADRLKRLEEQADWLVKKMNATSKRGSALCTRLEELHDTYGEPPVPPPMPDVLPSRRLPSSLPDLPRQVSESPRSENNEVEDASGKDDAPA